MRRSPLLLLLAAVLLLPASAADAKPKRCGKHAVAVGPKKRPKACVPKAIPRQVDTKALAHLGKLPKRARSSAKAERLARELLDVRRAKQAAKVVAAGPRARAASSWADSEPKSVVTRGDKTTATWEQAGHDITSVERNGFVETEARDSNGAGTTLGFGEAQVVPDCPTAAGDVPASYQDKMTYGKAAAAHGKRHWFHLTLEFEGKWRGHVGVGGKAETFDLDMRGTVEVRSGVEIAATGKVLKREPTRTYRAALTKQRLPIGVEPKSVIQDLRLRGPKGNRATSQDEIQGLGTAGGLTVATIYRIQNMLEKGDQRWYDARACAKVDYTSSPANVTKGGQGDWDATVLAQDDTPASDAIWTPASTCGALTASGTRGPKAHFTVTDSASNWSYEPSRPACVTADVTSPAGRASMDNSIFVAEEARYRFDIGVVYRETMGDGVTPTNMTGTASAEAKVGEDHAPAGEGTFSGTEWDGTVHNACGEDMQAERGFSGIATAGADIQDDGTVTVAWTANERPFTMAWIVNIPLTPGTQVVTRSGAHPFCGEPGLGKWNAVLTITITKLG
jgi:hypothetical protein